LVFGFVHNLGGPIVAVVQLDLANLKIMDDGRIEAAFAQEMKHVVLDLMDRPGDDRERSITLKVKFSPVMDVTGELDSVDVQMDIGSKMPSRKSRVYDMKARRSQKGPMLVFNEDSLDNADQTTIFDKDNE
jgi:hypothetical protein